MPTSHQKVTFGYRDRTREERIVASIEVRCEFGRIQSVHGRLPDGTPFVHPEPDTLAFVLDGRSDVAYPRHEPGLINSQSEPRPRDVPVVQR